MLKKIKKNISKTWKSFTSWMKKNRDSNIRFVFLLATFLLVATSNLTMAVVFSVVYALLINFAFNTSIEGAKSLGGAMALKELHKKISKAMILEVSIDTTKKASDKGRKKTATKNKKATKKTTRKKKK